MGKYGQAAIQAAKDVQSSGASPADAWDKAVRLIFPTSEAGRKKGCPRATFLGLCENAVVRGVPVGILHTVTEKQGIRRGCLSLAP